jgi:SAM-dependent methyltransferase
MQWFLFPLLLRHRPTARDPLAVTMCGARPGERILQIGLDDPALAGALASKAGLNGSAAILVSGEPAAARARAAGAAAGALIDVATALPPPLPYDDRAFDLIVVHAMRGLATALGLGVRQADVLRECYRVLRPGGRIIIIERGARGPLSALFGPRQPAPSSGLDTGSALEGASFNPVRRLGDREGYLFTEGMRGT